MQSETCEVTESARLYGNTYILWLTMPASFQSAAHGQFVMAYASEYSDPLLGRAIAYERLVGSQLIQEEEPFLEDDRDDHRPPPPAPPPSLRAHPKAPYLRLVVSQDSPAFLNFGSGDLLQQMADLFTRLRPANSQQKCRMV